MPERSPHDDELARRRALRNRETDERGDDEGDDMPRLGWRDVVALIIAAYQVLLPILGAMIAVLLAVYLLFRLLFH
ncbi:MAG TPA: hypothetical protein VGK74_22040 [Symbiobacteriaceae bacterium]|jgi:hypothetical protein